MMKNAAIICVGLMLTLVTASGKEYDEGVFSLNGSDWMLSYWNFRIGSSLRNRSLHLNRWVTSERRQFLR